MRRISMVFFPVLLVLMALPTASLLAWSAAARNLEIVQGIVSEKWELGRWQVDDDTTFFEGYSRLRVTAEYPRELRGKTFTIYYSKWDVPRKIIPGRKGVRCAFAVPAGTLSSGGNILWPLIRYFWLNPMPPAPRVPRGKVADSY